MPNLVDAAVRAVMQRASAASGTAVFVDPVIVRGILKPLADRIKELEDEIDRLREAGDDPPLK